MNRQMSKLIAGFLVVLFITAICMNAPLHDEITVSEPAEEIRLPVIMYHSIIKDSSRWGAYVISPDDLESDLAYIRNNGYTTVTVQDLVNYVYKDMELPPKPIMLTFDDGYYNNYLYAFPLLQKYKMKAVLSIIGRYADLYTVLASDNPMYSHATWAQINEMAESGWVEIQNHSYNMHSISKDRTASMKNKGETDEQYRAVLIADAVKLQSQIDGCTGKLPQAFAYPFGLVSRESGDILKEIGFKCTFSCTSGVNVITNDPNCLYMLKRNLRTHGKSLSKIAAHFQ